MELEYITDNKRLKDLEDKIERALEEKLRENMVCSIDENEITNEIEIKIEMESDRYEEEKVESLRELITKLRELGYKVRGEEKTYWTAETTRDLITDEIIDEREALHPDYYYMYNIRIWISKDKLDRFEQDILRVINSLKAIEQKEE